MSAADKNNNNSKSAMALVEVREKFVDYAQKNPDKVNERDLERLKTDDWYLKRYLLARNRKVQDTLQMLKHTMEWRNEFGIHLSEDSMFPQEFYKIGALFPYENDKKGNLVLYMRIKYHKKITELVEVEKHFLVHTFEKIDRITNGNGLVIVFDCHEAGYSNCDVEFLQFLISCATEHAPVGLQYIIVYKLPWVLNAFWSLARKLLPAYLANRVRFCDETSVLQYIDKDNLPDYMGGNCRRNYRWIPPGSPSVFKLAHAYGISDEDIEVLLPQFQAFLDEADEALKSSDYVDPPEAITRYMNNAEIARDMMADLVLSSDKQQTLPDYTNNNLASKVLDKYDESLVRVFPQQFCLFTYDSFDGLHYATLTIFNPSSQDTLAFKLRTNRPTAYRVQPCKGLVTPGSSITLNLLLLEEHDIGDKFLLIAQSVPGLVEKMTASQFESLWSQQQSSSSSSNKQTCVRLVSQVRGSPVVVVDNNKRKQQTSETMSKTYKNGAQIHELMATCQALKRSQTLSILINVILLLIIINLLYYK